MLQSGEGGVREPQALEVLPEGEGAREGQGAGGWGCSEALPDMWMEECTEE